MRFRQSNQQFISIAASLHASYLAMLGASSIELKESLGHKTLAVVARYAHLANSHERAAAAAKRRLTFLDRRRGHGGITGST